jgi:hypothetical protein
VREKVNRLSASYQQLRSDFANVKETIALAAALPRFFRERITLEQAKKEIERPLSIRVKSFLRLVNSLVYASPHSPYLRLLKNAGCDFADLASAVEKHGLEKALVKLAAEGVYLTSEEFKGKTDTVRGRLSFRVSPQDFLQPDARAGYTMESSGTRNAPVKTFSSLRSRELLAHAIAVFYGAHDLFSASHAVYEPVLAGRIFRVLIKAKLGLAVDRWFARNVASHAAAEDWFHYLNAHAIARMGNWYAAGIASPQYLDPQELEPILAWMVINRQQGKTCCLGTVISNAVRIARKALEAGISLEHVTFEASGEPLTQAKKRIIEQAGARIAIMYGPGGGTGAALGCGQPSYIDEMHVPLTLFTVVEHPAPLDGAPLIHPLLLTTTNASAPRFLLNVQNGDYATLSSRDCGCPLQQVGFVQHLHTVRSFEKLTGEGMNYAAGDLFDLLENAIPSEFGGGPGDYQLVEEEDGRGQTWLTLLVHPDVGELDNNQLLCRLQAGLAQGSRNHRFISKVWKHAGAFRVQRGLPYTSSGGKTLPLHIKQKD